MKSIFKIKFRKVANDALANARLGTSFEVQQKGGLFVPYGEHRHPEGLQRFTKASAEEMARRFKGRTLAGTLKRALGLYSPPTLPVYIGHPDVPGKQHIYTDSSAYGWITDIVPKEEGVVLEVKWNEDGEQLVAKARYKFYSPYWDCADDGKGALTPIELISVGLTNRPNIDVPPLANEATGPISGYQDQHVITKSKSITMNEELKKLLKLPSTATDDDIIKAVAALTTEDAANAGPSLTQLQKERMAPGMAQALYGQGADITMGASTKHGQYRPPGAPNEEAANNLAITGALRGGAVTRPDDELRRAANERDVAVQTLVDAKLAALADEGRVLPAELPPLARQLCALANVSEVVVELNKLAKREVQLKTTSVTDAAAAGAKQAVALANEAEARRSKFRDLVDQEKVANERRGMSQLTAYNAAFDKVSRNHPELLK